MRFSLLLLPFALLSGAVSSSLPKRRSNFTPQARPKSLRAPTTPNEIGLSKRQRPLPGAVVGLTLCAQLGADVDIAAGTGLTPLLGLDQLLGLGVNERLCICVAGGVLTDASVAQIRPRLNNNLVANLLLLGGLVDLDAAVNAVADALVVLLGAPVYDEQDTCPYPPNSIPEGCDASCRYTCAQGFTLCGTQCLASCPSGIPAAGGAPGGRRSLGLVSSSDLLCAKGRSACGIVAPGKGGKLLVRGKFECLDTTSNVETCGGCIVPLAGGPQGIDCTALPFVSDVSCTQGRCAVHSCEPGYQVVYGQCVKVKEGDNRSLLDLDLDLQAAADAGVKVLGL